MPSLDCGVKLKTLTDIFKFYDFYNKNNSYNYHKIHFVARLVHLTCATYLNSAILGIVSCARYFNSTILGEFRVKVKVLFT